MVIIPNSRFQQEAGQTETVKQPEKATGENETTSNIEKSGETQKAESMPVRRTAFDQYMPEKEGEEKSYGHYEVVPDGEGHSKVQFDDPDKSLKKKAPVDQANEKNDSILHQGQKLQQLKKKKQQLKQKIKSETDPGKSEELKRKLAQIEREIKVEGK